MKIPVFLILLSIMFASGNKNKREIRFGVFADSQYSDNEKAGTRFYRNSIAKLNESINTFNNDHLLFVTGLGDLIDHGFNSFDNILRVLEKSESQVHHVTGNHDFAVAEKELKEVPARLGLKKTYYEFSKGNWRFIFLDGNEITINSGNPAIVARAKEIIEKLKVEGKPNSHDWNGGISEIQLQWLDRILKKSDREKRNVLLFCHYPLLPYEDHALWNSGEVLEILEKHRSVKAYFCGHNHAGNYVARNGIHYVTFKGMVETEKENSFAEVTLKKEHIVIKGFGREKSKDLLINDL